MSYMVCTGFGDQLSDGHPDETSAETAAQSAANRLGATVYIYGPDDTDETATPVEPVEPEFPPDSERTMRADHDLDEAKDRRTLR